MEKQKTGGPPDGGNGKDHCGQDHQIRLILMAVLSEGHVLLDDLPGVGKTTLVKTLSKVLGCDSRRVPVYPDLLPSDIVGMRIYDQQRGQFQLMEGPVMTNLLLADEINRTSSKTQSALLEVMEEGHITLDGVTRPVPAALHCHCNPESGGIGGYTGASSRPA